VALYSNTKSSSSFTSPFSVLILSTTDELNNQLIKSQKIEKSMGNLGRLVEGLNKIPILGQFIPYHLMEVMM
jgi:hypothetical protein